MPAADGSIIIDTRINTDGYKAGAKDIESACRRTAGKMGGIGEAARVSIAKAMNAISKAQGKISDLDKQIDKLKSDIKAAKETPVKTAEFQQVEKDLQKTQDALARVDERKRKFLETGGKEDSTSFKRMEYDGERLSAVMDRLLAKKQEMESSGTAYTTADTSGMEERLSALTERRAQMVKDLGISYDDVNRKISDAESKARNLAQAEEESAKGGNTLKTTFESVAQKIKDALTNMLHLKRNSSGVGGGMTNGIGKAIKTLLRYGFAIRSTYMLVNKLKRFTMDGLKNMAQYSSGTNAAISSMMSALTQLKNSLGAAFAPIVETVAPYITSFINLLAGGINAVNAFISALLGRDTYTKAVAVQQDYVASLGDTSSGADKAAKATKKQAKAQEELNRQLMGFDEIQKLNDNSDSGGSGGSGGGSGGSGGSGGLTPGMMFTTESIPGMISGWADMFKDAWKNADFTEIGGIIGAKLRDALDSIPWDTIKDTAKRVAKSLATLLNGFFETEGLSQSIGKTVAEAFNTGFDFVNTFLENFHFDSFGKFISSGIQAALERFNWSQIGRTLSNLIISALDFGQGFLDGVKWDKLGNTIYTAIRDAVLAIKFGEISNKLFTLFGNAIDSSESLAGGFFGGLTKDLETGLAKAVSKVKYKNVANIILDGLGAELDFSRPIVNALSKVDAHSGQFSTTIKNIRLVDAIYQALKAEKGDKTWTEFGASIGDGITKGITDAINRAKAVILGFIDYIKDIKIDFNPFSKDFGVTLPDKDLEVYVKARSKQLALDNDNIGVNAKTDEVNWAPSSQRDLNVNAKTKDVDVKNKGVNVDANSKDVDVKNKGVGVNAKTKSVGWQKNPNKNVSVTARAPKVNVKNNNVNVKAHVTSWSYGRKIGDTRPRAKGGVLQHGVWHDIPQYAGGSLNAGSMFVAGERGPEVVGHIGGRTEVLNKSQIASAIYSAVIAALASLKPYFSNINTNLAQIPSSLERLCTSFQNINVQAPVMASGTVIPPQAIIATEDANALRRTMEELINALDRQNGVRPQGSVDMPRQPLVVQVALDRRVAAQAVIDDLNDRKQRGEFPMSAFV